MFKIIGAPLLTAVLSLDGNFDHSADGGYQNIWQISFRDFRFARGMVAPFRPVFEFGGKPLLHRVFVARGLHHGAGASIGIVEFPTDLVNDRLHKVVKLRRGFDRQEFITLESKTSVGYHAVTSASRSAMRRASSRKRVRRTFMFRWVARRFIASKAAAPSVSMSAFKMALRPLSASSRSSGV